MPSAGRITVLGDSLAVSPSPRDSFPSVLEKRLRGSGLAWTVANAGVRGETTCGGLRRLDVVLADRPDILIIALGANDGLRGLDVTTMSNNLEAMIVRAISRKIRVLLCGMDLPAVRGFGYARAYRQAFADLAATHDLPFVPYLLAGVAMDPAMNGDDAIHPNAAGANQIASTIWPVLENQVRQVR